MDIKYSNVDGKTYIEDGFGKVLSGPYASYEEARKTLPKPHSKYDHWTDSVRLNQGFARVLFEENEPPLFVTNAGAYVLYAQFHAVKNASITDPFMRMNVRNQLCKMVQLGILIRVQPGKYRWSENMACKSEYGFANEIRRLANIENSKGLIRDEAAYDATL